MLPIAPRSPPPSPPLRGIPSRWLAHPSRRLPARDLLSLAEIARSPFFPFRSSTTISTSILAARAPVSSLPVGIELPRVLDLCANSICWGFPGWGRSQDRSRVDGFCYPSLSDPSSLTTDPACRRPLAPCFVARRRTTAAVDRCVLVCS